MLREYRKRYEDEYLQLPLDLQDYVDTIFESSALAEQIHDRKPRNAKPTLGGSDRQREIRGVVAKNAAGC